MVWPEQVKLIKIQGGKYNPQEDRTKIKVCSEKTTKQ